MIVIVYGYEGSGPGHWQRWLEEELGKRGESVLFPELPDPLEPQCARWVEGLAHCVKEASGPVTFVAHSLGCWAVDHFMARYGSQDVWGALLVAPPSPYLLFEPIQSFFPPPLRADAWRPIATRSLLVGSDNDPYIDPRELEEIAARLGIPLQVLPCSGHINLEAGFGPWPFVLEWLAQVGALGGVGRAGSAG